MRGRDLVEQPDVGRESDKRPEHDQVDPPNPRCRRHRAHVEASQSYFFRKDVQQEIRECWQQESRFANRPDYFRFIALNTYAFCFLMMQDDARLTDALNLIGHCCTPKPWEYVSLDPYWLFVTTRAELGLPELQERS